jgi:type IV pilus assembly protein PilW
MSCPQRRRRRCSTGFSLIELMVSMVIALVATLAISSVLVHGERSKRSTASVTDLNQTGAYVAYTLDRQVRNAGSGFAQRWSEVFGCRLNASKDGVAVLPRAAAIASPFASAPLSYPLAPVLIQDGGADSGGDIRGDLVTVMAGTGGFSETPPLVNVSSVQGTGSSGSLRLANTLGFHNGDLVILGDAGVPQGCMTVQVDGLPSSGGGTATLLPLAGQYYTATGSNVALGSFGGNSYAMQIGNALGNPPQFAIYGVGADRTLFTYDLFQFGAIDAPVPLAEGVVEMRAIYGLDETNPPDGTLDRWVLPTVASGFDIATLSNGSDVSRRRLRQIIAVRLGFVLRTPLKEREMVLGSDYDATTGGYSLQLFSDLDASVHRTHAVSGDDRYYRFRTIEMTVPLRNVLLAPPT